MRIAVAQARADRRVGLDVQDMAPAVLDAARNEPGVRLAFPETQRLGPALPGCPDGLSALPAPGRPRRGFRRGFVASVGDASGISLPARSRRRPCRSATSGGATLFELSPWVRGQ